MTRTTVLLLLALGLQACGAKTAVSTKAEVVDPTRGGSIYAYAKVPPAGEVDDQAVLAAAQSRQQRAAMGQTSEIARR